jgi:hypothetical protein
MLERNETMARLERPVPDEKPGLDEQPERLGARPGHSDARPARPDAKRVLGTAFGQDAKPAPDVRWVRNAKPVWSDVVRENHERNFAPARSDLPADFEARPRAGFD